MNKASTNQDIKLRNELILLVIAKLALLSMIWWVFFSEQRVTVDPAVVGSQVVAGSQPIQSGDKE
ncbi:cytochrome oxidase putative small subunit CydP [Fluviibacter phosphoraccumulans]|jgi:hypothetical protein|uniref:Uncharacterized protein n=1 Tax=Fluviibacter phosphoraccumulans TaxID=1751046 RepID=A0A7R6R5Z3_9RHOO|nr:hypothetical protein ICHIAU1_20770 [Fluviibacter phosphoraccumulans]BBU71023.1 hypothetical protein ICHIJ1_09420 [Fluviibacter phosphoraccumulans]